MEGCMAECNGKLTERNEIVATVQYGRVAQSPVIYGWLKVWKGGRSNEREAESNGRVAEI
jgi:hypothetical protein